MKRRTEQFDLDRIVLRSRNLVNDFNGLDGTFFRVMHGDALGVQVHTRFAQKSGLREFLGERMVCDSNRGIEAGRVRDSRQLPVLKIENRGRKSHPSAHSNVSSGLTKGTGDLEMKLPLTKTFAVPLNRVYSEAFLILA